MLDTLALTIGRQIIQKATATWLGHRRAKGEREAELADLVAVRVTDPFSRRKLIRQLEDIGDQIARRLSPLAETEFRDLPDNEREAALLAVTDALVESDLTDDRLFQADLDARKVARAVRDRVPDAASRAGLSGPATALYNLVLDESCVCLVGVVQQLPPFQSRALTALLGRFSTISDEISQLLQRLPRTSLDAPQGTEHDAEFTRRYLALLSETLDGLELFGVDVRRYRPRTSVTVAYLGLTVTSSGGPRGRPDITGQWTENNTARPEDGLRVEQALAVSPRTLLRGLAGSGKTTLLQWIAVNTARGSFSGPLARWNDAVPFFVRLRSYPEASLPQPQDMINGEAGPIADQAPEGWAHRQFGSGKALLLVDGVDELRAERRPHVRRWLSSLLTAFPDTEVVVTSRPSAAEANWLGDNGFGSLLLEPMSQADVAVFCRHWHDAIRDWGQRTGALPCSVSELDEYETVLRRHLDARRHLRTLATNPLLCAMLCALNLDRRKQLPPDRMTLYEAALDLLVERRDAEREIPANEAIVMDVKTKRTVLQHVAWWLTLNGRAEATLEEALEQVTQAISRMPDVQADPTKALRHLLDRSGVLREPVTGRVDFVHRTFQEYLAGKQAADEHHLDFLVHNAHLDQWRDTVIMGAGHCSVPLRGELLNSLLDRADREPRHARRLRLVAAACLETTHTVAPDVAARAEAALDELIPPRRLVEAKSLTVAGDRLLRRLPRALDDLAPTSAAACVRAAALTGGPEALALLAGYATDGRHPVQIELAGAWKYFPPEVYAKEVLADAPLRNGTIEINQIDHVRHLRHLSNLRRTEVVLGEAQEVSSLEFLHNAPSLVRIRVSLTHILNLHPLAEHASLAELHFLAARANVYCTGLDALNALPLTRRLNVELPPDTVNLDFIRPLAALATLAVHNCADLRDCSAVIEQTGLESLDLWGVKNLRRVSNLRQLRIARLGVGGLRRSAWRTLLAAPFPKLWQLNMAGTEFTELELLRGTKLTDLWLQNCPVSDLSPLAAVPTLRTIMLNATNVTDLGPLLSLPKLELIDLYSYRDAPNLVQVDLSTLSQASRKIDVRIRPYQHVRGVDQVGPNVRLKRS